MGSESALWTRVRAVAAPLCNCVDLCRVENSVGEGTPDVSYCVSGREGWIELKHVKAYPKRDKTPIRVRFEPGQVPWIKRRMIAGGQVWLLIQVARDYYLFSGVHAELLCDGMCRADWAECARHVWAGHLDKELWRFL